MKPQNHRGHREEIYIRFDALVKDPNCLFTGASSLVSFFVVIIVLVGVRARIISVSSVV